MTELKKTSQSFELGIRKIPTERVILLMVQKSGDHQLRLVFYPIIYKVLYIPGG